MSSTRPGGQVALELVTLAEELIRAKVRRRKPGASAEEQEAAVRAWRLDVGPGHEVLPEFRVRRRPLE